jgi:hypothetical protein
MNVMKLKINIAAIILFSVMVFTNISCRKKGETSATITVLDVNGNTVTGATVELHSRDIPAPGAPGIIEQTKTSDASGQATFIFDLEAVLTIEAKSGSSFGTGSVRLEKHENVKQKVTIR